LIIKFIDLFAGIGGFREGLEREDNECVGWCEFDKFKQQAYKTVHNTEGEWFNADITDVQPKELPKAELYTGGFPCQSFSIAGNRGGFEDTRGTLFFEIARLAKERQPKYLLLENVKGLLSHDGGKTFATILQTLWDIGYDIQWQVLNSKDFSTEEYPVPQNRERIFIVGHLRGEPRPKVFPIRKTSKRTLKELTSGMSQGYRVYDTEGLSVTLAAKTGLYSVRACITPERLNKRQNGRRFKEDGEPSFTVTAQDRHGVAVNNKIRKLTPLETFRLQGFPDKWYHKCKKEGISDTQMYRAAGDAVTVNVVQEIGKRLKN
jgi:DNA (cytosine-5)-methyltransferase 1